MTQNKSCKDCTKCCEGYLAATIRGHKMHPTTNPYKPVPCIFVEQGVGCKEYDKRPWEPCKTFRCEYLKNDAIPENYKPSVVNALPVSRQTKSGIPYLALIECGEKMDPGALSWYFTYAMHNGFNFSWVVENQMKWMGSPEFIKAMEKEFLNKPS